MWRLILAAWMVCGLEARAAAAMPKAQDRVLRVADRNVAYEVLDGGAGTSLLVLLPGTSGPGSPYYRSQAELFQRDGFTVLLMHYFDATGSQRTTDANYRLWVNAVRALVAACATETEFAGRRVVLVGYSLGASIALAAGSEGVPVTAIAEWYGSLPDVFFRERKGMPPLLILHGVKDTNIPVMNAQQLQRLCEMDKLRCESHLYTDQGHGFSGEALEDADRRTIEFLRGRSR